MEHCEGTFRGYGGIELYYQFWRPEAPPRATLAVVHGFGEHSGRYGNVVNWFVPRGYAVHAFDMRGNGRSPGGRGCVDCIEEYRGDVRAFLDQVSRMEAGRDLFLLGHSQGGLIALDYVLHGDPRLAGIVASSPTLGKLPVSPWLVLLARALSRIWPRLTLKSGLDVTALSRDAAVVKAYVEDPLVHNLGTPRLGTVFLATIDWTNAHAADLALPCLIIQGSADRLSDPAASRAFSEKVTRDDIEFLEYEGGYHELFNDLDREKVLADVEAWLQSRLQA